MTPDDYWRGWYVYLAIGLAGLFVVNVASILAAWLIWAWWVNVR